MRHSSLFAFSLVFMTLLSCAPSAPKDGYVGPYTVTTLLRGVYDIVDGNEQNPPGYHQDASGKSTGMNNTSNMYLVLGKKAALLIDLSNNVKWMDNAADSLRKVVYDRIGELPLLIAITHSHGDHTGMKDAFLEDANATFLLPEADFKARSPFPMEKSTLFQEGYEIDLGGRVVKTLVVPGHTAGSTVFFLEGEQTAFTGDAIGSGTGVWIFSLDTFKAYEKGLDHFIEYLEDPANKLDLKKLQFYGGHAYQSAFVDGFDAQCVYDARTAVEQFKSGKLQPEKSAHGSGRMDTDLIFGKGKITAPAQVFMDYKSELGLE